MLFSPFNGKSIRNWKNYDNAADINCFSKDIQVCLSSNLINQMVRSQVMLINVSGYPGSELENNDYKYILATSGKSTKVKFLNGVKKD